MISLGQETVLNLSVLKKNYDALGNILHVPELRHADKPPSFTKLRARCEGIADYVGKVLASPVWNGTLGNFADFTCDCGEKIRKRLPHGQEKITAECFNCKASYTVTDNGDGSIGAKPELSNVPCPKEGCTHVMQLFRREIQPNLAWSCAECGEQNVLRLMVSLVPKATDETPAAAEGT
ncbi:hypothetical protein D9M69_610180 [compost metagenome]